MPTRSLAIIVTLTVAACGSVKDPADTCPDDQVECNEECVDLMSDPANCGECGTICPAAAHSSRDCVDGHCAIECHEGFYDIDDDDLTGCEYECDYLGEIDECNGFDDDCDGTIDNFDTDSCAQGSTVECTTTCGSTGTGLCDSWCNPPTPAECEPPEETCNGVDDDCDDVADQTFDCVAGEEAECTTTCGSTGTGTCLDTCQTPPPGACIPPEETCNGVDDDCMLGADDTFDCVAGEETACTSTCGSTGTATCTDECLVPTGDDCTPPAEVCNWVDDDCDGDIDEALWAELIGDVQLSDPSLDARGGRIEFGDSNYLVSYSMDPPAGTGFGLYTKGVSTAGSILGGGTVIVGPSSTLSEDVAWSGSEFLVGFTDARYGSPDVWGIRVGTNGESIGIEAAMSSHVNAETSVKVEWTGSAWGFGWIDQRTSMRLFLAEANAVSLIREFEEDLTGGSGAIVGNMDMVWNGSGYGVCWGDDRSGAYQLWFKVVTADGSDVVTDSQVTSDFDNAKQCTIAWDGSAYYIGWGGQKAGGAYSGYLTSLDSTGNRRACCTDDLLVSEIRQGGWHSPIWVEVAEDTGIIVAWSMVGTVADIMVQRHDFELNSIGDALRVSDGSFDTNSPALAWDGSAVGVVWERETGTFDSDVMFTRVGCP